MVGFACDDVYINLYLFDSCSLEATKSAILPELVELTNDEECHVRIAGLETVVNILSLLDAGKYTQSVSTLDRVCTPSLCQL